MLPWLYAFWAVTLLELFLWMLPNLRLRKIVGAGLIAPLLAASLALFVVHPSFPVLLLLAVSLYRGCNLLRLVRGRIHEQYLRRSTAQTSFWLIASQVVVAVAWWSSRQIGLTADVVWQLVAYSGFAASLILFVTTVRHIWTTRTPELANKHIPDSELPTLTVAIPARNETDDLEACLTSLIASKYPKLEILVLDDCSQNKRTSEIIRDYAHDGVRFMQGRVPDDNWLAKNEAYQQLLDEANGDLVLFCGVDVRFSPSSLRLLVSSMLHKHKTMVSVIPRNTVPSAFDIHGSTLLQPMRYAWELSLPRRLFRRPPVLSSCWIIRRDLITSAGGFSGVSRSIVPESYFARVSAVHDGYSFMRSSSDMGIVSSKNLREQRHTAIRTRYPQIHRRIELALLLSTAEITCLLLPYVLLAVALFKLLPLSLVIPAAASVWLLTISYAMIVTLTYRLWLTRSLITLPFAVVADVILLNYSMIRYEFFTVTWKGRNVCIPVMRVVDHLPPAT